jgi:phosphoribosylanthranilate isomerase
MRTRVKICGITRVEDAAVAVDAGADAVGLVFHRPSARRVEPEQARAIARSVPAFVTVVGLFVDPDPAELREILAEVPLQLLQFHGNETPDLCREFGRPYLKALRMAAGADVRNLAQRYEDAAGVLLDSHDPSAPGGTGKTFDWRRVPSDLDLPVILAGGLTPDNVARAIAAVRPYAVDVSSGVESVRGVKDPDKIAAFMHSVQQAQSYP